MIAELLIEERRAKKIVEEAKEKAEAILREARENAEKIRSKSTFEDKIDEMSKTETEKAEKEAEKIVAQYNKRIEELQKRAEAHFDEAVGLMLQEMLST